MSGRAKQLYEYAHRLEQIKIDLLQLSQAEVSRSLEQPVELLRKEAELELLQYEKRYLRDA